jgi:hypothetical protein
MNIDFRPLYWFYGIIGAAGALLGAGLLFGLWRVLQDHWR